MSVSFSLNFDYTSPFSRNASEHVLAALAAGADFDVRFTAFSLSQGKAESSGQSLWTMRGAERELGALAAGVVVRDRFPEYFPAVHVALFAAYQETGRDLREEKELQAVLEATGVDATAVRKELRDGWPYQTIADEHETAVRLYATFGTPTFVVDGQAAFLRVMTRPLGDGTRATAVVENIVRLIQLHPEINEFKNTKPYSEIIESIQAGRANPRELRSTIAKLETAARRSDPEGWRALGLTQLG
jgi:hypothetical protein